MSSQHTVFYRVQGKAKGSALVYILIAIALIAALTAVFMQPASQQTRTQSTYRLTSELNGQIQLIRSAIQDCILRFPNGDPNIAAAAVSATAPYPIEPDLAYYATTPAGNRAANKNVENIGCPGNATPASGIKHTALFGGSSGRFLPASPPLFGPWTYRNGIAATENGLTYTGVFFQINSTVTDAYVAEAMSRIDAQSSACEIDFVPATAAAANGCPADTNCLRVWMLRTSSTPTCP